MNNIKKLFSTSLFSAAMAFSFSGPAIAQTVADSSVPQTGLNLPEKLTIFGKSDPNVRKATAVINGDIITGTDVDHRLALIVAANGGEVSEQELKRLRLQVLRNLIDETLQIQEAGANDIEITNEEVNRTYRRVATENFKQSLSAFAKYLRTRGSSDESLKRQIKGELAWNRLLRRKIHPFVTVGDDEVNAIIERLNESKGTMEFRLSEIYLSATPETTDQVVENTRKIITQLRGGGSFQAYARQFSEASTAAVGGDLGWIRLGQLPNELSQPASQMQVGQIVGPIQVPGGFSVLFLADRRQVLTADPRDAVLSLKQMAIRFQPGTTESDATAKAKEFSDAAQTIAGCGAVGDVAKRLGADVVDNAQIRVRDLPAPLQETMLGLQVGQSTPPFGSITDGIRVLVLCGRDDPKTAQGPSFDQIMNRMEDERVNKRARIYLRDLRRDAIIDYN